MLMLIKKFIDRAGEKGLGEAISTSLSYLKWKLKYLLGQVHRDPIHERRLQLSSEIDRLLNSTVSHGPFKGLRLLPGVWWGNTDRASMLLGLYEQEILQSLTQIPSTHRTFIDVGAADGYYGVGVVINNRFDRSYCFEASEAGQAIIRKNAELNGVLDRVSVHGVANRTFYLTLPRMILSKSVLFLDVEGAEFEL